MSVDSSSFGLSVVSTLLLSLPPSKHRWVTSGVYLSLPLPDPVGISLDPIRISQDPVGISQDPRPIECIVCGDRKGSVFMFISGPTEKSKSSIVSQHIHCKLCLTLPPSSLLFPPLSLLFPLLFLLSLSLSLSLLSQLTPCQSYNGIHGTNGVTSITRCNDAIYSTGRDGYCRHFVIVRQNKEHVNSEHDWKLIDINKFHVSQHVNDRHALIWQCVYII